MSDPLRCMRCMKIFFITLILTGVFYGCARKPAPEAPLTPAQKEEAAQLEQKYTQGEMTQTEYEVEKSASIREKGLKF